MRKIVIIVFVVCMAVSMCYAQDQAATTSTESAKPVTAVVTQVKNFIGKVVSVVVADPAKGVVASSVNVVDDMGNAATFTVTSATQIADNAMNAVTLNQLKEGDAVSVAHKPAPDGKEEAASISVTK